jgi:hypothetical protein
MTLGAQFPTPINTTTHGIDFGSANASSANGSSVVVFTVATTSTNNDIHAQRLNSAGVKVGPEIVVSNSPLNEGSPSVAIDNKGDFVVAFTQIQPNGNSDVLARKFNPLGNPVGGIVPVAVGTFQQTDPHVAMDASGDFVVSYTRNTNNNNPDIFAKVYNVNEQQVNVISVATTPVAETHSSVAETPDGRIYVAYQAAEPGINETILKEYGKQGALLETRTIAFDATNPSVSVDNFDNAVVAYEQDTPTSSNILARRVSNTGVLGPVLNVDFANANVYDQNPTVALKRDGTGAFVVSYEVDAPIFLVRSNGPITNITEPPPGLTAQVTEVSQFNALNTVNVGDVFGSAVSINNSGQYLLTYTQQSESSFPEPENIFGRLGHLLPSIIAPPPGPRL